MYNCKSQNNCFRIGIYLVIADCRDWYWNTVVSCWTTFQADAQGIYCGTRTRPNWHTTSIRVQKNEMTNLNEDEYQKEVVNHLSSVVKQVQMEYVSLRKDVNPDSHISNNSAAGRVLFSCLEMILSHGLKSKSDGAWPAVEDFCRNDVKRTINNLINVRTSKGKSRAWIYLTLNERELESYFQLFQTSCLHFLKYYDKTALICSSHVSVLQTLISGLDSVTFDLELDVAYLDASIIMCDRNWTRGPHVFRNGSIKTQSADKGSVVRIDAKSISNVGLKAAGFVRGILSQEIATESMKTGGESALVAVNYDQAPVRVKKYCPDCGNQSELVCLCVASTQELPQNVIHCEDGTAITYEVLDGSRINPFDKPDLQWENIEMETVNRFDAHVAVIDSPIEVTRKPRKRRKRISSVRSVNSSDALRFDNASLDRTRKFDVSLSDPLIGFDPISNESSQASNSAGSLWNYDQARLKIDNINDPETVDSNRPIKLTDPTNVVNGECVVSQDSRINNSNVELPRQCEDPPSFHVDAMNSQNAEDRGILDGNENGIDKEALSHINENDIADNNAIAGNETAQSCDGFVAERRASHDSNASCGSQLSTPGNTVDQRTLSCQSTPVKGSARIYDTPTRYDSDDIMSVASSSDIALSQARISDVTMMTPEEKRGVRKSKSMSRYRSQSEKLLEDLTKLEVERLRAEVDAKLKPTREKLAKLQRTLLERSSEVDSASNEISAIASFPEKSDLPVKEAVPVSTQVQSSAEATPASSSISNRDVKEAVRLRPKSDLKTVAKIDNSLKLYLMLEVLMDENEVIIKMFHVSTGHSDGNWTALYLLFTDTFIYFLRSGDGSCPYQSEYVVSYEDMDYVSVGSEDQTIEFVFYTGKKQMKQKKQPRAKCRAKIMVDSCDKDLTDLIVSTLSDAVATHTRRHGVIKVCPPVFRDAREHQISLVKYLRSEGLTGDVSYYQLVHWEDPDFVTGANVAKVSMQGTLKHKVHSFWGSTFKSAYFVLSGGVLYQYANRDSEKPTGSYELTGGRCVGCRRIKTPDSSNAPGLDFVIEFQGDTKLEMNGYSVMEVTEWLQCLCMIVSLDQSSTVDQQACTDGIVLKMLNHDALVPCSLIVADETLLLCHEDRHTGFCRTLAKAAREDIRSVRADRASSTMCELTVLKNSGMLQCVKWGVFFPALYSLEAFVSALDAFSKAPSFCDDGDGNLTHYREARALLDSRWTRTDSLLQGRSGSTENYTFI